ncbi:hypothetical protein A5719_10250 [Mycolicibacterium peregrinum]|nr:hypothetical protein A5719_10250 [Mycolicibacterium peregrinum]
MAKLHSGEFKVIVTVDTKTGEETYRKRAEYPPEEALESLASRVRPLILSGEPIYYEKALDALEQLVGPDTLNDEIDLDWWRGYWAEVVDGNLDAQAYFVATADGKITDRKLMYAWLYGDVIHAHSPRSPVIRNLSIDRRYHAAAPGIARICDRVFATHAMITGLIDKGLLTVDPEVLTDDVVVTVTSVDDPVKIYTAELGVPLPTDLTDPDPELWQSSLTEVYINDDASADSDVDEDGGAPSEAL